MTQRVAQDAAVPPVGWAFVGTSGWVDSRFAPSVLAAGHRVVGAFGSSPTGSKQFADKYGCSAYQSLAELLADDGVEAVWVASPTGQHAEHARAAAAAGHAVLVEKPLTADLASARQLAADLQGGAAPTGVGFHHRFNPGVMAVATAIADGQLGAISSVVIHHCYAGPAQPATWRGDIARSGGWAISDLGTHLLDTARYLLGEVDFWAGRLSSPGRGQSVDDLSCLILSRGEATIVVRASTGTPGPASYIEVSGTKGWLRLVDFWGGGGRITDSFGRDEAVVAADPYVAEVKAFSAAVRGEAWTGASIADGLRVVELTTAAQSFAPPA